MIDVGLSTTPTVELEVVRHKAQGGLYLLYTIKKWNALKLLNEKGEFLNAQEGEKINQMSQNLSTIVFAAIDDLGSICTESDAIQHHIEAIRNFHSSTLKTIQAKDLKLLSMA